MNCHEIKNLISDYIDKNIEKDIFDTIKDHISSCEECKSELAYIKKYKKEMACLKAETAPPDFLEQINEKLNYHSALSKITQKLFYPLKIKLPLEAAGIAAIVILSVFIYNPVELIKDSNIITEKENFVSRSLPAGRQEISIPKIGKITKFSAETAGSSSKRIKKMAKTERRKISFRRERNIDAHKSSIIQQNARLIALLFKPHTQISQTSISKTANSVLSIRSAMPAEQGIEKGGKDNYLEGIVGDEVKNKDFDDNAEFEEKASVKQALKQTDAKSKEIKKYKTPAIEKSVKKICQLTIKLNGNILEEGFHKTTKVFEYIIIEIPASNKQVFMNRLRQFGSIKSNGSFFRKSKNDFYKLKIQLIPSN